MRSFRLLAILIVAISLAPLIQAQSPAEPYKVEGVVINAATGKPLNRALVQIQGSPIRDQLTGLEGKFSFENLPQGTQYVTVSKPGYFRPGATDRNMGQPMRVQVGPDTGNLILKLLPEAVIAGQVTGKSDEPLEGASIQVFAYRVMDGRRQLTQIPVSDRTDEDGNFRIAELPAGEYYVAVKPGWVSRRILGAQTATASEGYPLVVYYPTANDAGSAMALNLNPGQQVELHFALKAVPTYKVSGVVVGGEKWKQIQAPLVQGQLEDILLTPDQFDPATGEFSFRALPSGTYSVRTGGADQQGKFSYGNRRLTVTGNINNLKLSLVVGADIPIVVHSDLSKPRQMGHCTYNLPSGEMRESDCSDYPVARVELMPADNGRNHYYSNMLPDSGPLMVSAVNPGKYLVKATSAFGGYVQSLRCGGQDLMQEPLVVTEGGSPCEIEVTLRDDYGSVRLHVNLEKPGQQSTVLFFPDQSLLPDPQLTVSNAPDNYLATLAPGSYRIYAFDPEETANFADPELLAKFASRAAHVTVSANSTANVSMNLIHTGD